MKATELMIGDWVRQKHSGLLLQVSEIVPPYIRAKGEDGQFKESTIEPIPLTPEILVGNGFVLFNGREKMYRWKYDNEVWVTADFKSDVPWVSVVNTCFQSIPYCPYLHQLQHALLLCGIVKELKPMSGDSPVTSGQSEDEVYKDVFGFDLSVRKEVPSMELIAKMMKAGLTSNTTDTEIEVESARLTEYGLYEPHPGYWDTLPERVPLAVWSAKELEKMLPPFINWMSDKPMHLHIYQAKNEEYIVGYENNDDAREYRDEVLANALAKMTLAILENPDLRKQYEDYYNKSKM